jgi:ligand-binding SRPBCC domain-containing protein
MRHIFRSEQWLPYPVDVVFAFFANPENLPRLMPPWQRARIEEATFAPPPPHPEFASTSHNGIVAGAGTKLKISFRPFPYSPVRVLWNAEISEFLWNDHFCDQQLSGPFAYWHHCHRVLPQTRTHDSVAPNFGTLLHDEVEYELPFGRLGDITGRMITHQLRKTFAYRHNRTLELLMPHPSLEQPFQQ